MKIMNRSLPRPALAAAFLASTVALWSVRASADPGCKTPFENGGCFVIETLAIAFLSAPVTIAAAAAILIVGLRKAEARRASVGLAALGVLPVVLVTGLATTTVAPNAVALSMVVIAAVAAAYATLVRSWLIRSARSA